MRFVRPMPTPTNETRSEKSNTSLPEVVKTDTVDPIQVPAAVTRLPIAEIIVDISNVGVITDPSPFLIFYFIGKVNDTKNHTYHYPTHIKT